MKTSNKLLSIGIAGVFGAVLAVLIVLKLSAPSLLESSHAPQPLSGSRHVVAQTYPFTYFSTVRASGNWDLNLQQGESYAIRIEAPEYLHQHMVVKKEQTGLILGWKRGRRFDNTTVVAGITLPKLDRLRISGSVRSHLSDFDTERLNIHASGSASIKGFRNRIHSATIKGSGAIKVDFQDNPITNAHVDLSGSSWMQLTMAGGVLTGNISGAGEVIYDGSISQVQVTVSGAGNVHRRK